MQTGTLDGNFDWALMVKQGVGDAGREAHAVALLECVLTAQPAILLMVSSIGCSASHRGTVREVVPPVPAVQLQRGALCFACAIASATCRLAPWAVTSNGS